MNTNGRHSYTLGHAALATVVATATLAACAANPGLRSPIREVEGTRYFTAEGRAQQSASWDFTKKLAWLSAASALARARSSEVYARLTQDQRARLEELLRNSGGRRQVTGAIELIDEATTHAPLREVHELRVATEDKLVAVTLGIPLETWRELVDEAAEETARVLRGEVRDLEAPAGRPRP